MASHTGSLAGEAEVYWTAFRQAGVVRAESLEQVFDFARILSTQPIPQGNKVQIITDGGGFGVLMSDWITKNNLSLAKMSDVVIGKMKKLLPPYVILKNPLDVTGDADIERYRITIEAALADPNVDIIAVIALLQVPSLTSDIVDVIAEASDEKKKPIIVVSAGGRYTEVLKKALEDFGVPCFSYPESAAAAIRALCEYGKMKSRGKSN